MDELKSRDVLDIIRRVAIFNGGPIADDLDQVELLLTGLFKCCRLLSADLEHALIFCPDSPLRQDVDNLDAWLDAARAPADIEATPAPARPREDAGVVDAWRPIETAPEDGTPIFLATIEDGVVYDVLNGHFECLSEDEDDGPWDIRDGEPWCSYVGREAGIYFCHWLPGKEWESRWKFGPNSGYTHWMPQPPALVAALGKSNG